MKKAYAYYRYSSHNQDNGNSISAQRDAVSKFAKQNNIQIVREYIDKAKTGTNTNREGYQKMLSNLEKHSEIKCVLVHALDRMHRNTREQLNTIYEFKSKGIKILTANGLNTMNKECISQILDEACQAEKYSNRLSFETRKGLEVNALKAIHNGGIVPYGFKLGEDKLLEIDESKAPAIRKIFEMYSQNMSYTYIIKWLDENGYKTVNGKSFVSSTIKGILENPKYCGIFCWDRKAAKDYRGKRNSHRIKNEYIQIKGGCPAIVTEEVFEAVQKRLRENKSKIRSHNGKNYYPMNGRIFCKKCGKTLRGSIQYSRTNKDNIPTKQYKFKCSCSEKKSVNQKYIDDMIIYALRECIFSSVNIDELIIRLNELAEAENKDNNLQIEILKAEKEEVLKTQKNLIAYVEKGKSTESICKRIEETEEQIKEFDAKISRLTKKQKTFTKDDIKAIKRVFVPYVRDVRNEDTICMINETISKIEVGDTIDIHFKNCIKVSRDTKKNFN